MHRLNRPFFAHLFLIAAFVAPVWMFPIFPTQDGPAHSYDAKLIREFLDPSAAFVSQQFTPDLSRPTNWTCQVIMAFLQTLMDPVLSEKIVISLCVALPIAGLAYLSRRVHGGFHPAELLGYVLAYGYTTLTGLYNYSIGLGLAFWVIGWWWGRRENMRLRDQAVLLAVFAVLYVTHVIPLFLAMTAVGWHVVREWVRRPSAPLLPLKKYSAEIAILLLGAAGILWFLYLDQAERPYYKDFVTWFAYLAKSTYLDTLRVAGWRGYAFMGWLVIMIFCSLGGGGSLPAADEKARKEHSLIKLWAVTWSIVYFAAPWGYLRDTRHYASLINERVLMIAVPLWVLAVWRPDRVWSRLSAVFLCALALLQAGTVVREVRLVQPQVTEFLSGVEHIEPQSTVRFESRHIYELDAIKDSWSSVDILGRMLFRYCLNAPEAAFRGAKGDYLDPFWPQHFIIRKTGRLSDYVVIWNSKKRAKRLEETERYSKIFQNRRLRVYENRERIKLPTG